MRRYKFTAINFWSIILFCITQTLLEFAKSILATVFNFHMEPFQEQHHYISVGNMRFSHCLWNERRGKSVIILEEAIKHTFKCYKKRINSEKKLKNGNTEVKLMTSMPIFFIQVWIWEKKKKDKNHLIPLPIRAKEMRGIFWIYRCLNGKLWFLNARKKKQQLVYSWKTFRWIYRKENRSIHFCRECCFNETVKCSNERSQN